MMYPPHLEYLIIKRLSPTKLLQLGKRDLPTYQTLCNNGSNWWTRRWSTNYHNMTDTSYLQLQWYLGFYQDKAYPPRWACNLFNSMCHKSPLDMVKLCVRMLKLSSEAVQLDNYTSLALPAMRGRLSIIRYLVEHFDLTIQKIPDFYFTMLHHTIERGHLQVVRYLVEHFKLTANDLISVGGGNYALYNAIRSGHLSIIRYLCERVGLTVVRDNDFILNQTYVHGSLSVVRYIVRYFKLTDYDNDNENERLQRSHFRLVLELAADGGHLSVIRYLVEGEGQTLSLRIANTARQAGHLAIVRYVNNSLAKMDSSCTNRLEANK